MALFEYLNVTIDLLAERGLRVQQHLQQRRAQHLPHEHPRVDDARLGHQSEGFEKLLVALRIDEGGGDVREGPNVRAASQESLRNGDLRDASHLSLRLNPLVNACRHGHRLRHVGKGHEEVEEDVRVGVD